MNSVTSYITNLKCELYRKDDFFIKPYQNFPTVFRRIHKKHLENCRNHYTYSNFVCSLTHHHGELASSPVLWLKLKVCMEFSPGNLVT